MKKVFVSLCMAATVAGLSSCASTKNAATLSSLSGEWNIIEINGSAVVPAPNQEFPFIGFDTKTGQVYGNSGCNRLMGSFDVNAKPGQIDLGALIAFSDGGEEWITFIKRAEFGEKVSLQFEVAANETYKNRSSRITLSSPLKSRL